MWIIQGGLTVRFLWYDYIFVPLFFLMLGSLMYYIYYCLNNFHAFAVPLVFILLLMIAYYIYLGWPYINILRLKRMIGRK